MKTNMANDGTKKINKKFQFYIVERHNPQLGVYYIAKGQISKAEITASVKNGPGRYGNNYIYGSYKTEAEYQAAAIELQTKGNRVHNVPTLPIVGNDYILGVEDSAYWASMNGKTVRVVTFPYNENGYENKPDAVLVKPVDGGLEFITTINSISPAPKKAVVAA